MVRHVIMKKAVVGIIAITALIGTPALAADMAVKAPPPPPPPAWSWTGFYVGANGGIAGGDTDWQYTVGGPNSFANHDSTGWLGGGTLGANYQFNNVVVGIEGDYDWGRINGAAACPNPIFQCQSFVRDIWTARGRLGLVATNNMLVYATAGVAGGRVTIQTVNTLGTPQPPSGTSTNGATLNRTGAAYGGGLEYAFAGPWSLKLELLHIDLSGGTFPVDNGLFVYASEHETMLRMGLNYKFY